MTVGNSPGDASVQDSESCHFEISEAAAAPDGLSSEAASKSIGFVGRIAAMAVSSTERPSVVRSVLESHSTGLVLCRTRRRRRRREQSVGGLPS